MTILLRSTYRRPLSDIGMLEHDIEDEVKESRAFNRWFIVEGKDKGAIVSLKASALSICDVGALGGFRVSPSDLLL